TMAVISLARIDDPRTTEMLMEVMTCDKTRIVRVYAWEAIHARQDRLTPEQRGIWVSGAFKLAKKNSFRGDLRLGLVGLLKAGGPSARNKKVFKYLFEHTNSLDPGDIRTLEAMGDTLRVWQSPDLIKSLIKMMSKLDYAYRAEFILRRVYGGITPSSTLRKKSSDEMWGRTQKRWMEWYKKTEFKEIDIGEGKPYAGLSKVIPGGEKITNSSDKKWSKDLELSRLRLKSLEVGFAVDSTGSMGSVVQWIKRDVVRMMRAFELISREPRISVLLYRDHGDAYVVQGVPLLDSGEKLAYSLRNAGAKGGGDIPEAVYEALYTIVKRQKWSKSSTARKVVVLVGDAPPQQKSLKKIEKLVTKATEKRFRFFCVKVRTSHRRLTKLPNYDSALATFDKIAKLGNGKSIWVDFRGRYHSSRWMGVAPPKDDKDSGRVILREVLKALLEEGYRDRVEPFVDVLIEYVETPVKEKRFPFDEYVPSTSSHKWTDPQAR
ncbi:MAG: VWA domain-containing protein, partial [Phycisphaerae bacterium]|nr:VWA domain-containing protein [Phycisphaerae bacterium]